MWFLETSAAQKLAGVLMNTDLKDRVRRVIIRETEQCMGIDGSKLSSERTTLKKRYLGYGYAVHDDRES